MNWRARFKRKLVPKPNLIGAIKYTQLCWLVEGMGEIELLKQRNLCNLWVIIQRDMVQRAVRNSAKRMESPKT